ncbi:MULTISPECIES: molybdopterin-binding protein [unclassified Pseudoclavibacter]|uniref:TOBE domain-containing protein n=1 Tax=unclassified Pseudoclavibacter TaxID=2615177 RepID=UPI000CE8C880|nr:MULTISPECIES: TOBE domain-containing protein [unclassified Pseudoclavibacter]MBF4548663.1 TOBE domain-containing protein [Pseudoclavibacter sp. VKM Ac-2888]PPF34985.1 MerR family transcriptional regulator [Pseudoclavibacter sp. AY1H1]PPF75163.1 MerR family transcriptional regulator [Pseudoclavibacter sp. Z016]PPG03806.1 MerR family transcriptional regulator [Pseudoclavibacter sp. RFBI5]
MAEQRYRVSEAASLLGVSDDTVRRWGASGRLDLQGDAGAKTVAGVQLAALAKELADGDARADSGELPPASARNRMRGIVTKLTLDTVMAQVEVQAGPFRIVSLVSREAVDELGLEVGSLVVASVKATNVGIEGVHSA